MGFSLLQYESSIHFPNFINEAFGLVNSVIFIALRMIIDNQSLAKLLLYVIISKFYSLSTKLAAKPI